MDKLNCVLCSVSKLWCCVGADPKVEQGGSFAAGCVSSTRSSGCHEETYTFLADRPISQCG